MSIGNANLHQRGEIPEILKLPNGRIRVIRRFHKFTREDVDNAALGSTMGDFGDLDTTGEQIANQGYTDCRLISVEVDTRFNAVSNADNAVLVKTYETLTSEFVQITDDTVDFTENGLKQVTRVYRAVSGTTSTNVIGTTTITSGGTTVYLASSKLDDNDAFAELTEQYVEAGTLSRTEDFVGSQDSLVIEAIGPDPATPSGFSLASKQESNFEGFQTNRFTFLKPSILSVQQEFNQPRDRITVRAFNKTSAEVDTALSEITTNHRLIAQSEDDFEGIKTSVYTFELNSHDVISVEENGLRTVTRSLILAAGTNYDEVVGDTNITHEIDPETPTPPDPDDDLTLYLASFSIQDTEQFRLVTEKYIESGVVDEQISAGPSGLPNTIVKTVRSLIAAPTSLGITLSESNRNVNGLDEYEYRFLEKADGTTPVGEGVNLVSYEKNIQVRQAGIISASTSAVGTSGSIAVLNTVPPSVKSVTANVTIVLTTSSSVQAPEAYNLSDTSASASVTTTRVSPVGVEQGESLEVSVFNTGATARTTAFPNHYYTGTSKDVSYSTPAQIIKDDDNIIGEALNETVSTSITLSGSTSPPDTTGIYQEDVDPVFFNANGTQYFRKTTYTIPEPAPAP